MNITYTNMNTCPVITVATNGHVWISLGMEANGDHLSLLNARVIRNWGTDKGLNQLVDGPTQNTVLDNPAPIVFVPTLAVIAIIPCREAAWEGKV